MTDKDVIKEVRMRMDSAIEDFKRKLAGVRTGRAAVSILDSVLVDYYGTMTPLSQLASVHAPEPQMLTVQPWDQTQIGAIEKAIRAADLGLNLAALAEDRPDPLKIFLRHQREDHGCRERCSG